MAGTRPGIRGPDPASAPRSAVRLLGPVIFLLSAVGLAYQIALMRVLSVAQWHHFAYMIISVAMLGFAVSGTAIALARGWVKGREASLFHLATTLIPLVLVGCYALSQQIGFETFELVSQPRQRWNLVALYLILALPFALVSLCIALGFLMRPQRVGKVYFQTMVGSGVGAFGAIAMLGAMGPEKIPYVLSAVSAVALLLSAYGAGPRGRLLAGIGLLGAGSVIASTGVQSIRVSSYKGLSYALQLPDARVAARAVSPLSVLTAVESSLIRETPGQLSAYPMQRLGALPGQTALYFDAGAVSPVHRFDGDFGRFAFLDYVTPALPYRLVNRPRVLVIGAGGGTEVLSALAHGARRVTAVEVEPNVFRLLGEELAEYSGKLYERSDVDPVVAEGRGFLEARPEVRYDLIQISLLDSFNASAAGVHALNESYLYTREAVELYLSRLVPGGVLTITRWLSTPPRDAIKMIATLIEAAEGVGLEPARHLVGIRSWNTATLALSRSPLSAAQVRSAREFASSRWFDLIIAPGLRPSEVNTFTVLEDPVYYEAGRALLSNDRSRFYREYPFFVRPATDDRPHYARYFRWRTLPLFRAVGAANWGGFVEWGYVALVATLVQAAAAAIVLVLLPLWLFGRPSAGEGRGRRIPVVVYFGALGLAFMFLEIAFIQKFMLLLNHPTYAVAVVLTGFLLFSGFGSLFADRRRGSAAGPLVRRAVLAIGGVSVLFLVGLPPLFEGLSRWSDGGRIAASLCLLAPLAFAMGLPFPAGLQTVSSRCRWLVPWAWGWNGAASVVGAALATLLAVHLGFRIVVLMAIALYGLAALSLPALQRTQNPVEPRNEATPA